MIVLDKYETVIISVFIVSVTAALIMRSITESSYTALMGAFIGYTFGRIFNGIQGKEEVYVAPRLRERVQRRETNISEHM